MLSFRSGGRLDVSLLFQSLAKLRLESMADSEFSLFDAQSADPESRATARLAISRWEEIATTLAPILGQREVTRLFERSILLCSKSYPWLAGSGQGFKGSMNLNALERSIATQPADVAAAGAGLLLKTVHDLLGTLIGPEMAKKLLPLFLRGE